MKGEGGYADWVLVQRIHDPNSSTEFMYRDYRVVVKGDGCVLVYERSRE